jgi:putative ABC transport system permease protein
LAETGVAHHAYGLHFHLTKPTIRMLQRLSYAWRSLRRAPLFSVTVVLALTLGLGSASAIFAIVNAVLLRPLPYGHPDRLVGTWHDLPPVSLMHAQQTPGTYRTYKKFATTITGIGLYNDGSVNVSDPDGRAAPERISVAWTTVEVLPLLEVSPILGRTFSQAEDAPKGPDVAVISEQLWRNRFGAARDVIGKKLLIAGRPTQIIGVMPAGFRFPSATTQIWLPQQLDPNTQFPGGFSYSGVARLKPGVSVEAAQRDFANVLPRLADLEPMLAPGITTRMLLDQAKPIPKLVPMRDDVVGEISHTLWIVAAAAGLVLLVTCANVANLLLVRADARHRELSVRAALGANRWRVMTHFFTESALLAGASSIVAIAIASAAIRILVASGPTEIPRLAEVHVDATVIVFTLVMAALVALACSAMPAIRFMRADPLSGLRDGGRGGTIGSHRQRARSALVAAQMAFALVVLASSGLLLRSFQRLHAVRPGFNPDGVATLWLSLPSLRYPKDSSIVRFYSQLTERAAQLPGVTAVGVSSGLPLQSNSINQDLFYVEGDAGSATKLPPLEIYRTVDAGYFRALRIPLLAGRLFDRMDLQRGQEAIISSETAGRFFHDSTGRAAIGKRFRELPSGEWNTIVGVVGSVRDSSLQAQPTRTVYYPQSVAKDTFSTGPQRTMALVAHTTGDVVATTRAMQRLIHELDPTLPTFRVRSMREVTEASIARLSFTMTILGVAAAVTLVLGIVGLYGVIAYVVTLRTRELGVRIALGAQPRAVAAMVTKQGLILSGAGIAIGLVLIVIVARFLRSFLFEVAPTDPLTLAGASGTLVLFALLASWIPARRAARVNPTEALRAD